MRLKKYLVASFGCLFFTIPGAWSKSQQANYRQAFHPPDLRTASRRSHSASPRIPLTPHQRDFVFTPEGVALMNGVMANLASIDTRASAASGYSPGNQLEISDRKNLIKSLRTLRDLTSKKELKDYFEERIGHQKLEVRKLKGKPIQ